MSDLLRSAMSARIAKLPMNPPFAEDEEEQEEQEERDGLGSLGLGPPAMPRLNKLRDKAKVPKVPNPEYAPISAEGYFDQAMQVAVPSRELDVRVYYTPPKFADGTVVVCHHGAGYSGLSFACFAKEVGEISAGECGMLSVDARRHGRTTSTNPSQDLDIQVLTDDLFEVLKTIFPDPIHAPTLLLVGHSMGGSVVVRTCPRLFDAQYRVCGVTVLDVVEGSAIEALPIMNSILNARPDEFDSVEEAVEWHVKTNTIRNIQSARISVPAIFMPSENSKEPAQVWRTPLRSTAPYWSSWFTSLSSLFLSVRTARLLILAGTDRLDKELMIGQMQGKFQMNVVMNVGHMLHEDDPRQLAEIVVEFWRRNERVRVGIKKVGEL